MAIRRMLVLGDSVPWGQGLLEEHKYHHLVWASLPQSMSIEKQILAHSGATIGLRSSRGDQADGEVPISFPTIAQQCDTYADSPQTVDLLLFNGGINDIDIRTILNPFTDSADLQNDIIQYCYADMVGLLEKIVAKFTNSDVRIVLTGYYPLLSTRSELVRITPLLEILGIGVPAYLYKGPVLEKIIRLSLQFWRQSNEQFAKAVSEANRRSGSKKISFVPCPFQEQNSIFADDPWLFGLNADLSAQDEVIDSRHSACDIYFDDPLEIAAREQCYRASAGHPNTVGSRQLADAIVNSLTS